MARDLSEWNSWDDATKKAYTAMMAARQPDPYVVNNLGGNRVFAGPRSQQGDALRGMMGAPSAVPTEPYGPVTPLNGGAAPTSPRNFR